MDSFVLNRTFMSNCLCFSEIMAALRSLTRSVPPTKAGPFIRLVGSLDFKGQGTKHELESLDPYVLCDDGGTHVGKGRSFLGSGSVEFFLNFVD